MSRITIFTPTYNRIHLLPSLYKSLCEQTLKDFIWLIIDDGSIDGTENLVSNWKNQGIIRIEYRFQSNAGKMAAHNYAVDLCETDYFVDIDSDDIAEKNCIQSMYEVIPLLDSDEDIAAAAAHRFMKDNGNQEIFKACRKTTLTEINNSGFKGETTLLFKTKILRQFKFPSINGEKFIPEGYIYKQIEQKYFFKTVNEYWVSGEYCADGYTMDYLKLNRNNPNSFALLNLLNYKLYGNKKDLVRALSYHYLGDKSLLIEDMKAYPEALLLFPAALALSIKRKVQYRKHGL